MTPLGLYRAMSCNTRLRIWLSVAAVAYSTVGAVAQVAAPGPSTAASPWQSPAAVGLVLSAAGVLIGVGAFVQTVKQQNAAIAAEQLKREQFEIAATANFARKDVVAVELAGMRAELRAVLAALGADAKGVGNG